MKNKRNIFDLTMIALMAAVLCILGPLSLPIGPIPISLATLVIYVTVVFLGMVKGTISCLLYLCIGLIGLPVFSGFSGGPGKMFGPTGGYLFGYLVLALIAGFFVDRFKESRVMYAVGMVVGTAVMYAIGTVWLAYQMHLGPIAAMSAGVFPFLIGDAGKIALAVIFAPMIKSQMDKVRK